MLFWRTMVCQATSDLNPNIFFTVIWIDHDLFVGTLLIPLALIWVGMPPILMTFEGSSHTKLSMKSLSGSWFYKIWIPCALWFRWGQFFGLVSRFISFSPWKNLYFGECCLAKRIRKHVRDEAKSDSNATTWSSMVWNFIFRWIFDDVAPKTSNVGFPRI